MSILEIWQNSENVDPFSDEAHDWHRDRPPTWKQATSSVAANSNGDTAIDRGVPALIRRQVVIYNVAHE